MQNNNVTVGQVVEFAIFGNAFQGVLESVDAGTAVVRAAGMVDALEVPVANLRPGNACRYVSHGDWTVESWSGAGEDDTIGMDAELDLDEDNNGPVRIEVRGFMTYR